MEPPPPAPLDNAEIAKPKAKGKITQWFNQNPLVGPVTFAVGVLSLAATIFFGVAGFKTRELSLYINPSKTTIVKSGQTSDLHVLYKGTDVPTDVTALQVELWNAGKESIRPEQVLVPIILETTPRVPILEARIRHISRPLTQVVLDHSHIVDGKVTVSWNILEYNDGAVIQFILAGPADTSIKASGAMVGQPRVNIFHQLAIKERWLFVFGILCFLLLIAFQIMYVIWLDNHGGARTYSVIRVWGPLLVVAVFLGGLFIIVLGAPSVPIPFD